MKRDLFFFTDSYPFSVNYEWKRLEIEHLIPLVSNLTVVPFTFKEPKAHPLCPANAILSKPSIGHRKLVKWYNLYFLFSSKVGYYISEFFGKQVYRNKLRFISWFQASLYTHHLLKHGMIRKLLQMKPDEAENTVLYFYWTMNNALIIPHLPSHFKNVTVRLHGFDLYADRQNGYIPYQEQMLKGSDKIVCISEHGKTYLGRHYPDVRSKISVQYLGVEMPSLKPERKEDAPFHLVTCSRVIALKRLNMIVEVLKRIKRPVKWTHMGDGELFDSLKKNVNDPLLKQHTINLKGWLDRDAIQRFYEHEFVDVFVNVSWSEGLPVSIMEAASFGIPIIATDVGGTSEIVSSENGILLSGDFEIGELESALLRLMETNPDERASLRKASYDTVKAKFNFSTNFARFKDLLLN